MNFHTGFNFQMTNRNSEFLEGASPNLSGGPRTLFCKVQFRVVKFVGLLPCLYHRRTRGRVSETLHDVEENAGHSGGLGSTDGRGQCLRAAGHHHWQVKSTTFCQWQLFRPSCMLSCSPGRTPVRSAGSRMRLAHCSPCGPQSTDVECRPANYAGICRSQGFPAALPVMSGL